MNLNKTFILGNLTKDPELKQTPSGAKVCSFGVATNRTWFDKNSQTKKEEAEFHNVVAWGKTAELIHQYMRKGSQLLIEGRLQTRNWEGKDGKKNYRTEIVAENIQFGARPAGQQSQPRQEPYGSHGTVAAVAPSDDFEASLNVPPASESIQIEDIDVGDIPF